ncbi:MAG: secretin and TonB N-terminal domain-containing protein [Burkholderiales bacterium]
MKKYALTHSVLALALWTLAGGCATDDAFSRGKSMIEEGRVEEGLQQVDTVARANPKNAEYRSYFVRNRDNYVDQLLTQGDRQRAQGNLEDAAVFYQRGLKYDESHPRAQAGLAAVASGQRQRIAVAEARTLAEAGDLETALTKLRAVLAENSRHAEARALARGLQEQRMKKSAPNATLKSAMRKPVTLEFRDALLKNVFDVLSRTAGINFVFDRDVRPDIKTTLFLRNTPIEDAITFLLATNQLEKKILNDNTLLVYPNLPNKLKDYQDLTVRSFYLANADVKQTLNLIKTVVKTRDVFIDDRLNLLVMRDTPEAIGLAEKLIAVQDLAEPEVILEVEVLEISRNRLQELGVRWPSQVGVGVNGGSLTLSQAKGSLQDLTQISITDPAFLVNLRQQDGDTNLLANPRIRVKNREKAKIHIGDKLPVITTTSTANVGVSESVAYLDVGLKLDVEPNVYLEDEVAIKVGLEVSNIVQEVRSANGTLTYRLGTRNTATTLRLRNGETQALAGLIQDEERNSADKVPGLGDLPVLGRLFGSRKDERIKTEIVLLITPYVVRNIERPDAAAVEFHSGTDTAIGSLPLSLRSAGPGALPQATPEVQAAPQDATAPQPLPELPPASSPSQ